MLGANASFVLPPVVLVWWHWLFLDCVAYVAKIVSRNVHGSQKIQLSKLELGDETDFAIGYQPQSLDVRKHQVSPVSVVL